MSDSLLHFGSDRETWRREDEPLLIGRGWRFEWAVRAWTVALAGAPLAAQSISRPCLARTRFPLGDMTKTEVRAMAAEAVILFDPERAWEFELRRKRGGHLFSKLRFLSAQVDAYLTDGLWLRLAGHAGHYGGGQGARAATEPRGNEQHVRAFDDLLDPIAEPVDLALQHVEHLDVRLQKEDVVRADAPLQ